MKAYYPTTRPGWYDTEAIAQAKWKQQLTNPSSATAGLMANPQNTTNGFYDTKLKTMQKILKALQ